LKLNIKDLLKYVLTGDPELLQQFNKEEDKEAVIDKDVQKYNEMHSSEFKDSEEF
jgi:hypothetical protein